MNTAPRRPVSFLISLWVERAEGAPPVWRGALVTAAEQRLYFSTLAELSRQLCEIAGWQDPLLGEPPDERKA